MRGLLLPLLFWMLCLMAPAAAAQELESLQVYGGSLSEPPDDLPLQLPVIALSPAYDEGDDVLHGSPAILGRRNRAGGRSRIHQ